MTDKYTEIGIPVFQFIFERQRDEWTTIVKDVLLIHSTHAYLFILCANL